MTDAPEVIAFQFDGHGGSKPIALDKLAHSERADNTFAFAWVHLFRDDPGSRTWLNEIELDQFVIDALTADETRPRCTVHGNGAILNLRGVNLNPGAEPEDMISARFWLEEKRVIGVWLRPLMAVNDMFRAIENQQAPVSPGDLIAKLALRLADRAEPTVATLNDRIDVLEHQILDSTTVQSRGELADIRRTAITIRRYMVPQRDALTTFEIEDLHWLSGRDRSRLREAADRVTRLGEDLDAIRDRSQVIHDQLIDQRAEAMNQSMLLLSVVAAIFLPLGLLTGLLGINVGGIPGTDNPWSFTIVSLALVALLLGQLYLFRRLGFFGSGQ